MSVLENMQPDRQYVKRLREPPVARALFSEVRWAWIWLILRLYAGWQWLTAGWGKINNPAWTGENAGAALSGFVQHSLTLAEGPHPAVQPWYAWFLNNIVLPNATLWSFLVAWGEFLVGVALIVGIFTGIAALFGSFMNMNYMLAGTTSTNPILMLIGVFLVLAWRTAGWWGLDRWVLPALGTPWAPGLVFEGEEEERGGGRQRPAEEQA